MTHHARKLSTWSKSIEKNQFFITEIEKPNKLPNTVLIRVNHSSYLRYDSTIKSDLAYVTIDCRFVELLGKSKTIISRERNFLRKREKIEVSIREIIKDTPNAILANIWSTSLSFIILSSYEMSCSKNVIISYRKGLSKCGKIEYNYFLWRQTYTCFSTWAWDNQFIDSRGFKSA